MQIDAKAPQHYIETLINILHRQSPDICGGPYYPFYLEPKPKWFLDSYGTGTNGDIARNLESREYLSGGNVIFRKKLLEALGWFNPELGMSGKRVWYGEETMVIIKAWKAFPSLRVYYDPDLFVYHLVPKHKMSVYGQIRKKLQMGRSHVYLWIPESRIHSERKRAPLFLLRVLVHITFKAIPKIVFRNRKKYPYWQNYVFEETSKLFSALGAQFQLVKDIFRD